MHVPNISNLQQFYESNNNNHEDYSYFHLRLRDMLCYYDLHCRIYIPVKEVTKEVVVIVVVVVVTVVVLGKEVDDYRKQYHIADQSVNDNIHLYTLH